MVQHTLNFCRSCLPSRRFMRSLQPPLTLNRLVFHRESSTEPSCDVFPSLWPARSIRDHLSGKCHIVSDIWPVYGGILAVTVVKAAEEWKISFNDHLLQIRGREQMLRYNLELTKRGNTALCASGTHREMRCV